MCTSGGEEVSEAIFWSVVSFSVGLLIGSFATVHIINAVFDKITKGVTNEKAD